MNGRHSEKAMFARRMSTISPLGVGRAAKISDRPAVSTVPWPAPFVEGSEARMTAWPLRPSRRGRPLPTR